MLTRRGRSQDPLREPEPVVEKRFKLSIRNLVLNPIGFVVTVLLCFGILTLLAQSCLWAMTECYYLYHGERLAREYEQCRSNVKSLALAAVAYRDGEGSYPHNIQALIPKYLKTFPACPSSDMKSYDFQFQEDGSVIASCSIGKHYRLARKGRPAYSTSKGEF